MISIILDIFFVNNNCYICCFIIYIELEIIYIYEKCVIKMKNKMKKKFVIYVNLFF